MNYSVVDQAIHIAEVNFSEILMYCSVINDSFPLEMNHYIILTNMLTGNQKAIKNS